jgi:metal-responsive CopG/Arc/MetJ family transcriptional regulator
MKVAVSIPDPIFAEAEALVKQFGTSRSELYRRALGEFISRHPASARALDAMILTANLRHFEPLTARCADPFQPGFL